MNKYDDVDHDGWLSPEAKALTLAALGQTIAKQPLSKEDTMNKYDNPFCPDSFRNIDDAVVWLKALDRLGMCFHLEDHPAGIIWGNSVPTMNTVQMDRLNRRREEYLAMLGSSCPFEYAHEMVGGGWTLPSMGNPEKAERAEHYIDALRELHEDPEIADDSLIGDVLADLMHLKGRRWLQDRMTMADCHFEEESEEA